MDADPVGSIIPRRSRRRTTLILLALLAALVTLLVWLCLRRTPAGPASGTSFDGPYRFEVIDTAAPLRVATFNIHGGRGTDDVVDIGRIGAVLATRPYDLVALQEVRRGDRAEGENQAEALARRLTRNWLFAPTEQQVFRGEYGNGVLSAVDVLRWERVPMQREHGRAFRNYVIVEFKWRDAAVRCLATHVDSRGDRDAQLAHIIETWLALPPPSILMGDLNARADHPSIKRLLAAPGVSEAVGRATGKPNGGVDWIFTCGFEVVGAGVEATDASDHPLVWAELKPAE